MGSCRSEPSARRCHFIPVGHRKVVEVRFQWWKRLPRAVRELHLSHGSLLKPGGHTHTREDQSMTCTHCAVLAHTHTRAHSCDNVSVLRLQTILNFSIHSFSHFTSARLHFNRLAVTTSLPARHSGLIRGKKRQQRFNPLIRPYLCLDIGSGGDCLNTFVCAVRSVQEDFWRHIRWSAVV